MYKQDLAFNNLWEEYESSYPPSYVLNSTTTIFLEAWLWHLITYKGWYAIKQRKLTPLYIYIYIYMYMYIAPHRQTVSLYHNCSVWLDTQDASRWDWNPHNFTLYMVTNLSAISAIYIISGIITQMYKLLFVYILFYLIPECYMRCVWK